MPRRCRSLCGLRLCGVHRAHGVSTPASERSARHAEVLVNSLGHWLLRKTTHAPSAATSWGPSNVGFSSGQHRAGSHGISSAPRCICMCPSVATVVPIVPIPKSRIVSRSWNPTPGGNRRGRLVGEYQFRCPPRSRASTSAAAHRRWRWTVSPACWHACANGFHLLCWRFCQILGGRRKGLSDPGRDAWPNTLDATKRRQTQPAARVAPCVSDPRTIRPGPAGGARGVGHEVSRTAFYPC